jgi:uncharacterized membrane protein
VLRVLDTTRVKRDEIEMADALAMRRCAFGEAEVDIAFGIIVHGSFSFSFRPLGRRFDIAIIVWGGKPLWQKLFRFQSHRERRDLATETASKNDLAAPNLFNRRAFWQFIDHDSGAIPGQIFARRAAEPLAKRFE